MKLKTGTWVLVADGGRALVLVNLGTANTPELSVRRTDNHDNPRTHEQGRDRPARVQQSGTRRKATHVVKDIHATNEQRFVGRIVEALEQDAQNDLFHEIVVAAAPEVLGQIRSQVSGTLARRVVAWVDKDYTKLSVQDITAAVSRAIAN